MLMIKRILAVDFEEKNYKVAEKEWLKLGIEIQMVSCMKDVINLLVEKNEFTLIVICTQDNEYLKWLESIRNLTITPIFIMVFNYDKDDQGEALKLGADEYMQRPSTVEESISACLAHMRRFTEYCHASKTCESAYCLDNIYLCKKKRTLFVNNKKVDLTKTEFELLSLLISKPDQVFEFEQLYKCLRGYKELENPKVALKAHIKRLRIKLNYEKNEMNYIKSIHGLGYKFM